MLNFSKSFLIASLSCDSSVLIVWAAVKTVLTVFAVIDMPLCKFVIFRKTWHEERQKGFIKRTKGQKRRQSVRHEHTGKSNQNHFMTFARSYTITSIFVTSKWWKPWRDVIWPSLSLLVRPCVYVRAQRSRVVDGLAAGSCYVRACERARTSTARAVDRPSSVIHQPFMLVYK